MNRMRRFGKMTCIGQCNDALSFLGYSCLVSSQTSGTWSRCLVYILAGMPYWEGWCCLIYGRGGESGRFNHLRIRW